MSQLGRVFHAFCVWVGLADPSEWDLTGRHGWPVPVPAEVRSERGLRGIPVARHGSGSDRA